MDNWIEILIPVVIVLVYLFQRIWGGDESDAPPPGDSKAAEEARKIQEDIRRKVVARQQGRKPEEAAEPEAEHRESAEYPEHFERYDRSREPDERAADRFEDSSRPAKFERYGEETETDERSAGSFLDSSMPDEFERYGRETAPGGPDRDYETELREQLKRVREAKQARQHAVRRSRETVRKAPGEIGAPDVPEAGPETGLARPRYRPASRGAFLDELHNRNGLQKAFILKEILGQPVGARSREDSYAEFSRRE